jgi:inhibitor of Bruton tyrosine kinase
LQLELDQIVRERHPDLAAMLDHERRAKSDSFLAQTRVHGEEYRHSNSPRAKSGGIDGLSSSPISQKPCRKSPGGMGASSTSPALRSKSSGTDLMFDMDEGDEFLRMKGNSKQELQPGSPVWRGISSQDHKTQAINPPNRIAGLNVRGEALPPQQQIPDQELSLQSLESNATGSNRAPPSDLPSLALSRAAQSPTPTKGWGVNPPSLEKLSMKEIMEQASANRTSNISVGLSSKTKQENAPRGKMSQKERKKQQHQDMQLESPGRSAVAPDKPTVSGKPTSPWQSPIKGPKVSLKDILSGKEQLETSHLQALPIHSHVKSETDNTTSSDRIPLNTLPIQPHHKSSINVPQATPPSLLALAEPSLQLSLSEIISQQQREREIIKGTVLKRSLTEIQQEQEFQSWWEAESARVRGEEEAEAARARVRERRERGRGRRGGRGRGSRREEMGG